MASTRSTISPGVFAFSATTVIPPTPLQGVAYRNAALAIPAGANAGWPYAVKVNSADYNQILYSYSTLLDVLDKRGVLGYTDLIDYTAGALVLGSDNQLYTCTLANGPGTAVQDPVSAPTYWSLLRSESKAAGDCQLSLSGANLLLAPKNGNRLMVNGVLCTIPAAGVTLAPPAVASTLYYIYAVATAGVITSLENSVTGHSTDATAGANQGVEIKTGDATRSLVGMARTTAANAWADTVKQRFVESWFNPVMRPLSGAFTAQRSTGSATPVELNTEIRVEWVTFGRNAAHFIGGGTMNSNSSGSSSYAAVAIDSTTVPASTVHTVGTNLYAPLAASTFKTVAEGYHYATMLGWASATTGFYGNGTNHNNLEGFVL